MKTFLLVFFLLAVFIALMVSLIAAYKAFLEEWERSIVERRAALDVRLRKLQDRSPVVDAVTWQETKVRITSASYDRFARVPTSHRKVPAKR